MAGLPEIEVPGCAEGCEHEWGENIPITGGAGNSPDKPSGFQQKSNAGRSGALAQMSKAESSHGQYCQLCGGWRGSLGLEPTIEMYVGHLVLICKELKRVLRDDGVMWWNMGDSYAAARSGHTHTEHTGTVPASARGEAAYGVQRRKQGGPRDAHQIGLKTKDLCAIPWRVALALQADGWYLRSDIIWAKGISFCPTYSGSCMPESVLDRPTKGHEYVFLLSKQKRYFYDGDAVRESAANSSGWARQRARGINTWQYNDTPERKAATGQSIESSTLGGTGRNLRTVWTVNPGSYKGAHFATWPPKLVRPMIKAGTSERGCCSAKVKKLRVREDLTEEEQSKIRAYLESKGLI
jgi:hypothetical protein